MNRWLNWPKTELLLESMFFPPRCSSIKTLYYLERLKSFRYWPNSMDWLTKKRVHGLLRLTRKLSSSHVTRSHGKLINGLSRSETVWELFTRIRISVYFDILHLTLTHESKFVSLSIAQAAHFWRSSPAS